MTVLALCLATAAAFVAAEGRTGRLRIEACFANSPDSCREPGRAGAMKGAVSVVASPDGRSIYVISSPAETGQDDRLGRAATRRASVDDTSGVAHFRRRHGRLRPQGCLVAGAGKVCAGGFKSLFGAQDAAISPDGKSLYVVSGEVLTHFGRNPRTGALKYRGCLATDAPGCADIAEDALLGGNEVVVSPDGKSLYVSSYTGDSVLHFRRSRRTGGVTYAGCVAENGEHGCAEPAQPVLDDAEGLAVSPDGNAVYVVSGGDTDAVAHLHRDRNTGGITYRGCVAAGGRRGCAPAEGDALLGADAIAVSPDGTGVYVVGALNADKTSLSRLRRFRGGGIRYRDQHNLVPRQMNYSIAFGDNGHVYVSCGALPFSFGSGDVLEYVVPRHGPIVRRDKVSGLKLGGVTDVVAAPWNRLYAATYLGGLVALRDSR